MNRSEFLRQLKGVLGSEEGCTLVTTEEKKEGFSLRNRHDIKWGQVDANGEKYVRVVIDLAPGYLDEKLFSSKTGLLVTPPRKINTGYRFTKKQKADGHDQLILFLEDSFFENDKSGTQAIFEYASEFAAASGFKSQASR